MNCVRVELHLSLGTPAADGEMREGSAKQALSVVALLLVLNLWGCQGVSEDQAEHARAAYPTKHNCSLVRLPPPKVLRHLL